MNWILAFAIAVTIAFVIWIFPKFSAKKAEANGKILGEISPSLTAEASRMTSEISGLTVDASTRITQAQNISEAISQLPLGTTSGVVEKELSRIGVSLSDYETRMIKNMLARQERAERVSALLAQEPITANGSSGAHTISGTSPVLV